MTVEKRLATRRSRESSCNSLGAVGHWGAMRSEFAKTLSVAALAIAGGSFFVGGEVRAHRTPAKWGSGGDDQQVAAEPSNKRQSFDDRAQFEKGQRAIEEGDLDTAEAAFRQVLRADPRSAGAYSNLGVIAMRRKSWEQALKLLRAAEKLDPHMAGIRLNIGLAEYRQGDYVAAIAPLESVVREQPDSPQARYLLGLCELFTQHWNKSVEALEPLWPKMSNDVTYL